MSFGRMPIANGFLTPSEIANEYFFELAPAFCERCGMFQIIEQPRPEKMFHAQYAFFSSTSRYMQAHFERIRRGVISEVLAGRPTRSSSNSAAMTVSCCATSMRAACAISASSRRSMSPTSRASAAFAQSVHFSTASLPTRSSPSTAGPTRSWLPTLCVTSRICLASPPGVQRLLKPDGVFIFEDPYLGDMIEKTAYDQIYDEHVFIFSVTSVQRAFAAHGLELVDVAPQITHGGSMRYMLAPKGSRPVSPRVAAQLANERAQGLDRAETYQRFKENCENSRTPLMQMLEDLRREGKRVVGYGATSKSTTVTNYCGITPAQVEFISDTTPIKQGKLSPGAHIPVRPYDEFTRKYPDCALLFAWNHAAEIRDKEQAFIAAGGRWLVYVPEVKIVT